MKTTLRLATSPFGRRSVLAAWAAAQLASPLAAADVVPAPGHIKLSQPRPELPDDDKKEAEEKKVRLNVFNRTWPDILQKLADDSGSTLILQDPPPGRWTRTDYRTYSRAEAIAILNRELEPKGFRILENGDHLIVMSERTMRKQYRPAVLPQEDEYGRPIAPKTEPLPEPKGYSRQFDQIVPVADEAPAEEPGAPRPLAGRHPFETAERSKPARRVPVEEGPAVTVSVRVGRGSAASVAKEVHKAFGTQSELADAGPNGLPAFRVLTLDPAGQAGGARQVSFEVEIDTARDELLVTAPRTRAGAVAELLRDLDRFAGDPDATVRIAPATEQQLDLAAQIAPVLAQVAQEGQPAPGQPGQPMPNGQDAGQGEQPNENRRRPGGNDDLPALIGNLRGEVSVESVPDLGVLILRGNDQDVQAVLDVIRTLENLSAGQQPVIELLRLEHVDSTALSELLTTLYEQLARVRNRGEDAPTRISVLPVVKPNAVLIVAPEGEIDSVLDLASELDQPVDPTKEFEVFPLRNANAEQAAETITEFYTEPTGLEPRVTVVPDIRTNSLVVSARPRDMEEISSLVRRIDSNESGAVSRLKVYPLKSAAAEELAEVINTAIQSVLNPAAAQTQGQALAGGAAGAGGEAAQQLRAAKSAVLEFLDASGDSPQLLRSGLLADVRVTADPRTNSLLVSAGEQSLPLIDALINQLDRPAAAVSEIKVFSLENSDAASVVELLDGLFGTDEADSDDLTPGVQLAGAAGDGSSLIPLRFGVDVRTNSVIATGSGDALRVVEAILLRLDESDVRNRQTTVVKLKNAPADQVAEALTNLLTSQRELITIDEDLVSNTELLEREIIVVPETVTNSLIISATPRFFEEVQRIVSKLDEAPPQVIIQAMLVEVDLDNADEFGIELGLQDSTLFDRSVTTAEDLLTLTETVTAPDAQGRLVQTTTQRQVAQGATPGFNFNNQPLGNNISSGPGSIGTQGLSNFSLGRTNADLGYGGFVFSASSANVNVLLRALSAKRTIHVLSRPQIRTLDNQEAQIQVGQNVPVINGFTQSGLAGGIVPTVERDDAGLILTVIPRISPDGNIVMVVAAERSEYSGAGVPIFTDPVSGTTLEAPIKDVTAATATVSVPTGQTIVMGGIITRSDDTIERKVPYLGDIPYVGALFRYDSTRTRRRELLIFLTPRVIFNDADSELIKQVEADRLHFIEHEAESIHGPLYSVPPAGPVGPPMEVPPVVPPGGFSPEGIPSEAMPPGAEAFPGLPADACPPGTYPPGTLFDGVPPLAPQIPGPTSPPPPAQGGTPTSMVPPAAPPAEGSMAAVTPTGHAVGTGRLAGRAAPAKKSPPKKKSLLPRFGK